MTSAERVAAPTEAEIIPIRSFPEHVHHEAVEAVSRFALLAATTPMIPIPVLDGVAASALQIGMISELSRLYGQKFSQNVAGSLVGAAGAGALSLLFSLTGPGRAVKEIVRRIPLVGPFIRWTAGPFSLALYTYLLGMAFIQHFETGGSFESFDRKQFAAYLRRTAMERFAPRPLVCAN